VPLSGWFAPCRVESFLSLSATYTSYERVGRFRVPARPATRPSLVPSRGEPSVWAVCEAIVRFHDVYRQSVALSSENARLWLPSSGCAGLELFGGSQDGVPSWKRSCVPRARRAPFRRGGLPRVVQNKQLSAGARAGLS
jgi:hypothetical protein